MLHSLSYFPKKKQYKPEKEKQTLAALKWCSRPSIYGRNILSPFTVRSRRNICTKIEEVLHGGQSENLLDVKSLEGVLEPFMHLFLKCLS